MESQSSHHLALAQSRFNPCYVGSKMERMNESYRK